MATKTAKTTEKKIEGKELKRFITLWINFSKDKKSKYLSGVAEGYQEEIRLVGFFNSKDRENPKQPDIRLYVSGNESKEVYLSLWCNATENGKKYLSGKFNGKRVVGFFNSKAEVGGKIPYINIYFSDDQEEQKPETKVEAKQPEFEEIPADISLPF